MKKKTILTIILATLTLTISAQDKNLEIVKEYAESYSPTSKPNRGIAWLKNVPENVVTAFLNLKTNNKKEHEKYLTLIFIKLYSAHLQCCHQSYEIRSSLPKIDKDQDPLIYEFNLFTNYFQSDKSIEFISSDIAYKWTQENSHLLEYDKIKEQVKIIEKIQENIEKGVYWKD